MRQALRAEKGDGLSGERIRRLRIEQGFSQNEMARAARVSPRTVTRWETGQSEPQLGPPLRNLAAFLRVTPGYLWTGTKEGRNALS